jgi:hypothetical protein
VFYPVKVKKLSERRRSERLWREVKIMRRDDAKDKCYRSATWLSWRGGDDPWRSGANAMKGTRKEIG